jgi:ferric-dicitrate binding protein FerR (iron transport regulator)
MAKTKEAKSAVPYARRLLEDEYVQEQLRHAAAGLRVAYERARSQRGQATEDKRLYRNLQQAATSIREAILALQRPKPEPRRGRGGKIGVLMFALGGTVWLTVKLQKPQSEASSVPTVSATRVEPAAGEGGAAQPVSEPHQFATNLPPIA